MIDIKMFQALLLLVCMLGFVGGVFAGYVINSRSRWLHVLIKLFFAALAVSSGMAGLLLVVLK